MAKITLNDGTVVEGNVDEIEYLVKKLSNEEIEDKTEFKVGDYVKLSIKDGERPYFGWGGVKNGEVGVIKEIQPDGVLKVDFPSFSWFSAKPNELIKLSPREATFARAGRKVGEFKEGDIAKVIRSPLASPVGSLVEVVKIGGFVNSIQAKGWSVSREEIVEYLYRPEDLELVAPVENRVDNIDTEASD